jgi:hypothetical protein
MHTSIFLAQFFTIYLTVIGLALLFSPQPFYDRARAIVDNPGLMLVGAIFALIFGIILILLHSLWMHDWRVVITIMAWIIFTKGVIGVLCPRAHQWLVKRMNHMMAFRIIGLVALLLAGYLGYHGFGLGY